MSDKSTTPALDVHSLNLRQKICAMIGEIGPLAKKNKNEHFNYKYTGHDQIMEALAPLIAKYGVCIEPPEPVEWKQTERGLTSKGSPKIITQVKYQFIITNADKPEEPAMIKHVLSEALDSEDKGFNKASTQADKYLCFRLFRIATPADDPDALHTKDSEEDFDAKTEGQRRVAQFQVNTFLETCVNKGKTAEQIAAYLKEKFKIVQVEEMMRKDFNEAIKWAHSNGELKDTLDTSLKVAKKRTASQTVSVMPERAQDEAAGD